MKIKILSANEYDFKKYLNSYIKKGWKPKFESFNVVRGSILIWHYIILVKE